MKKLILIVIGVLAVTGVFVFKAINRGPVNIKKARGLEVAAPVLYNKYVSDPAGAAKLYTAKILSVSGTVGEVTAPSGNRQAIIKLVSTVEGAFINCTLEQSATLPVKGAPMNLKGICTGIGEGDADLGIAADVYLSRCIITDQP